MDMNSEVAIELSISITLLTVFP